MKEDLLTMWTWSAGNHETNSQKTLDKQYANKVDCRVYTRINFIFRRLSEVNVVVFSTKLLVSTIETTLIRKTQYDLVKRVEELRVIYMYNVYIYWIYMQQNIYFNILFYMQALIMDGMAFSLVFWIFRIYWKRVILGTVSMEV